MIVWVNNGLESAELFSVCMHLPSMYSSLERPKWAWILEHYSKTSRETLNMKGLLLAYSFKVGVLGQGIPISCKNVAHPPFFVIFLNTIHRPRNTL